MREPPQNLRERRPSDARPRDAREPAPGPVLRHVVPVAGLVHGTPRDTAGETRPGRPQRVGRRTALVTSPPAPVLRRKVTKDQATYVQDTYPEELAKTNVRAVMADVTEMEGYGKYTFDVCTTDRAAECESGDSLVVPNIAEAKEADANQEGDTVEGFYSPGSDMQWNGLSVEENCRLIAEHEFVHFWYQYKHGKWGGLGSADPDEWADLDTDDAMVDALGDLRAKIAVEQEHNENLDPSVSFQQEYQFLDERLEYALDPGPRGSTAAETPAVLHEMTGFLTKRLALLDADPTADVDLVGRLRDFQKSVSELNDKFPRGPLAVSKG